MSYGLRRTENRSQVFIRVFGEKCWRALLYMYFTIYRRPHTTAAKEINSPNVAIEMYSIRICITHWPIHIIHGYEYRNYNLHEKYLYIMYAHILQGAKSSTQYNM